jgi:hypothetical protein
VSANGAKLVASIGWATDTTDWAPFAQQMKDSGAQGVMYFGGTGQPAGLQKAADAIWLPSQVRLGIRKSESVLPEAGGPARGRARLKRP